MCFNHSVESAGGLYCGRHGHRQHDAIALAVLVYRRLIIDKSERIMFLVAIPCVSKGVRLTIEQSRLEKENLLKNE